jgi:hypothetical protein
MELRLTLPLSCFGTCFICKIAMRDYFCLDEISFRRDYKSCRIGVVVVGVRRSATFMETFRWDNFCNFGATFLVFGTVFTNINIKIGPLQPPKKNKKPQKKTYGFSRWDILPML